METLPIMPDNIKSTLVLSEDEVVELFSYLLTTARVQIDDPDYYGPMRLLSAAEKLRDFVAGRSSYDLQEFFEDTKSIINKAHLVVNDTEKFTAELDRISAATAKYLLRANEIGGSDDD